MIDLYLIRHPPVAGGEGVCYGASDLPLAEDPRIAALRLGALLPARFALLSSPAQRCLALARGLGEPEIEPRLGEIDFGAWELRRWDQIDRSMIDAWAADPIDYRPPGGESVRDMSRRAIDALTHWRGSVAGALVIVAHGGPLRAIAGTLLGLPAERWLTLDFKPATLAHLRLGRDDGVTLKGSNL